MNASLLIARIIGPFYLIVGIGILLDRDFFRRAALGFDESPALFYLSAVMAYAVGALIIALHNVWSGWPVVITLLGWAAVLKGAIRVLAPAYSRAMVGRLIASPNTLFGTGIVTLVLGAFLTAMGFGAAS